MCVCVRTNGAYFGVPTCEGSSPFDVGAPILDY